MADVREIYFMHTLDVRNAINVGAAAAEIRYFHRSEANKARDWLVERDRLEA